MGLSVTEAWNLAMRTRSRKCNMLISDFTSAHTCFQNRECVTTGTVAPTPLFTRKSRHWSAGCVQTSGFVAFRFYKRQISRKDVLSCFVVTRC